MVHNARKYPFTQNFNFPINKFNLNMLKEHCFQFYSYLTGYSNYHERYDIFAIRMYPNGVVALKNDAKVNILVVLRKPFIRLKQRK